MQIIITNHARDKIKERLYLDSFKEMVNLGIKAYYSKQSLKDKCYIAKYKRERAQHLSAKKNIVYKYFEEFIYIFEVIENTAKLITVYDPHLIKWQ